MSEVLEGGGVVWGRREAVWLVEAATGRGYEELLRAGAVDPEAQSRALHLARRRAAGEPLQYVTGLAGFRRLLLRVGPGVFIPRPETELVAGRAMELARSGATVVDVGTGSGAIALSIATERPDLRVIATESSPMAMGYARTNATEVGARVELIECDLLTGLPAALRAAIDVVVSNPPYVPLGERAMLPRDVVDHEPHDALFADDGFATLRRLGHDAQTWLAPDGWLVSEIGDRQGAEVLRILESQGYRDLVVRRDLTGRERIAEARLA